MFSFTKEEIRKAAHNALDIMAKNQHEEWKTREKLENGVTSLKDAKKSFDLLHRERSLRKYFDKRFEEKIKTGVIERDELDDVHHEFREVLAKRLNNDNSTKNC